MSVVKSWIKEKKDNELTFPDLKNYKAVVPTWGVCM